MYQLDIKIGASDVSALKSAGQTVAIVQEVSSDAFSGNIAAVVVTSQVPAVVWVAVDPAQNATLSWNSGVSIYQSGPVAYGTSIVQSNTLPNVSAGVVYPYTDNGFGAAQTPGGTDPTAYYVSNGSAQSGLTFGLARDCFLNGNTIQGSPFVNCNRAVLSGEFGCFEVKDQIHLFVGSISGVGVLENVALVKLSTTSISDGAPVTATYANGAFTFA